MKPSASGGFTLIEILVAVTIAAFVFTVGVLSLRTYMQAYHKHKTHATNQQRNALFAYLFLKQLQNIPSTLYGRKTSLEGDEEALTFITTIPITSPDYPGPRVVQLKIHRNILLEREHILYNTRTYKDYLQNKALSEKWRLVYTASGNTTLSFCYHNGKTWLTRWDASSLPTHIALCSEEQKLFIFPLNYYTR